MENGDLTFIGNRVLSPAARMNADESIVLSAVVEFGLAPRAFRARLPNGHRLVAFFPPGRDIGGHSAVESNTRIRVRMSPFDMGRGEIVEISEKEEGQS